MSVESKRAIEPDQKAVIANGGTKTPAIETGGGYAFCMFKIPSGWTGGASVSYEVGRYASVDSEFGSPADDADSVLASQDVTAGRWYRVPEFVAGAPAFKIVAASAVSQDEEILLAFKS